MSKNNVRKRQKINKNNLGKHKNTRNNIRKRQKIHKNKIDIHRNNINNSVKKDIKNNLNNYENVKDKKNEKNYSKMIFLFLLIVITLFLFYLLFIPRISFKNDNLRVRYNSNYIYDDFKARNVLKDYSKKVKIKNEVNVKEVGDYRIKYTLRFGFLNITKVRIVEVIDDVKPKIKLKGDKHFNICPGKSYQELGFEAIDEYDGDLTKDVEVESTKSEIKYSVKDESGNIFRITRKLIYEDVEKPRIELKGNSNMNLYVGDNYKEPGYKAIDNCDGDITDKVNIIGSVDTSKVGVYNITYKVKDNSNNEEMTTRRVEVKNYSIIRPSDGGSGKGIVYLTFDDGPNEGTTNVILDVLKEEGVLATFFVTCNGPDSLIRRMHNEGHTVALHTATHNYNYVYSSVNNYFDDLNKVSNRVKNLTGIDSKIIRFPGGSSNTISRRLSPGIMSTLTSEVKRRGYKYFDWNVDSNDAAGANANQVYSNVVNNISMSRENVVLMHDVKTATRDAIRNIIKYGKNHGFTFKRITNDTIMVTHGVNN